MSFDLITWIITGVLGLWITSMEVRVRTQEGKMSRRPDRYEVIKEIDVRLEPLKVKQSEITEDIKGIHAKLDYLIDLQIKGK